jgi:hypothetical protein
MAKASNQIDMAKEFDLQDINQPPTPQPLTPEQIQEITRYKEQVERTIQYRKKTVKTIFNADFFPVQGEINNKPSLTIPDQTLPIREILARFAKGIPVGVKTPIYEGEENNLPDPRTLDLVDIQNMKEAVKGEIKALAAKVKRSEAQPSPEQKQVKQEETKLI